MPSPGPGCVKCGGPLDPRNAWAQVVGYARPRSQRGPQSGSSLAFRRTTGRALCASCALELEAGIDPAQSELLPNEKTQSKRRIG